MKWRIVLTLLCAIALTAFQTGDTIRTDGVLNDDEWKDAVEYKLGSGYKVLLKKDKDRVQLAMSGAQNIWAHIYLSDLETVEVMHASAALDAVRYRKNNSFWLTRDKFQFEMREKTYDAALEKTMARYYADNGWVANNNNTGNGKIIEVKLDISKWKSPLYFACVMAGNDMSFHPFPTTLADDTVLPRLVQGYTPDSLRFEPTRWEKIK